MAKAQIEKIGQFTDKTVLKNTGKGWLQWIQILNKAGAAHLPHKEIVALLKKKYKLGPWWQQGITTGYEIHIGRRIEGQNDKGEYTVTATKTFPLDQKALWKLLMSPAGMAVWLNPLAEFAFKPKSAFEVRGGIFGAVRTMKAPARARLGWQDTDWVKPSVLNLHIVPQKNKKAILVFSHEALKNPRIKEKMRVHWKTVLADLLAYVLKENSLKD